MMREDLNPSVETREWKTVCCGERMDSLLPTVGQSEVLACSSHGQSKASLRPSSTRESSAHRAKTARRAPCAGSSQATLIKHAQSHPVMSIAWSINSNTMSGGLASGCGQDCALASGNLSIRRCSLAPRLLSLLSIRIKHVGYPSHKLTHEKGMFEAHRLRLAPSLELFRMEEKHRNAGLGATVRALHPLDLHRLAALHGRNYDRSVFA